MNETKQIYMVFHLGTLCATYSEAKNFKVWADNPDYEILTLPAMIIAPGRQLLSARTVTPHD